MKKIAVDAMTIEGGIGLLAKAIRRELKKHRNLELLLIGDDSIRHLEGDRVSIVPSSEIITGEDLLKQIMRKLPYSSTNITARLVGEGKADVGVSFANTKAVGLAVSRNLKPINGLKKIPLAVAIPSKKDGQYVPVVLLDVGATGLDDLGPKNLLEFGILGKYHAENFGLVNVRVGLLSNGTEANKGTSLLRDAGTLFERYSRDNFLFNYSGFVEGREVFIGGKDKPDVVITDGFTGNVLLKMAEGLILLSKEAMQDSFRANLATKAAGLTAKVTGAFSQMKKFMHPDRYGGASFLGLSQPFIKGHGASTSFAIQTAIGLAHNSSINGSKESIMGELKQAQELS
ncbi:MAG: hypothetical protein KKB31_00625 [Nanoarchaeota archaeon]|nr:hypothetical protein [Nanoarchaeota archaeon]